MSGNPRAIAGSVGAMRSISLVMAAAWLVGCASTTPRAATVAAPSRPTAASTNVSDPPVVALPDPCAGAQGLLVEPIAPVAADWHGALVVGGRGPVTVRWCGQGLLVIRSLTTTIATATGEPGEARMVREPSPERARLAHGDALVDEVWGTPTPTSLVLVVDALGPDGAPLGARMRFESVDDPERARLRAACEARGGRWGPHGLAGGEMCDAPTADAGQRCLSDADCEGPCIDAGGTEPLPATLPEGVEVPACGAGYAPRLVVGRCHERSIRFGCHARLSEVTVECIAPAFARRRRVVCVD